MGEKSFHSRYARSRTASIFGSRSSAEKDGVYIYTDTKVSRESMAENFKILLSN